MALNKTLSTQPTWGATGLLSDAGCDFGRAPVTLRKGFQLLYIRDFVRYMDRSGTNASSLIVQTGHSNENNNKRKTPNHQPV
jgi:hypothetical protein